MFNFNFKTHSASQQPFIGYGGTGSGITPGSRYSFWKEKDFVVIHESYFSYLPRILGSGLLGPGITIISWLKFDELIDKPPLIVAIVFLCVTFAWVIFLRWSFDLLSGRCIRIGMGGRSIILDPGFLSFSRPRYLSPSAYPALIWTSAFYYSSDATNFDFKTPNLVLQVDDPDTNKKITLLATDSADDFYNILLFLKDAGIEVVEAEKKDPEVLISKKLN